MKTPPSRVPLPSSNAAAQEHVYETGGSDPDFFFPPRRESRSLVQRVRGLPVLRTLFIKDGPHRPA